jgi:peptidoglycan hydrolase CwlO-like protein
MDEALERRLAVAEKRLSDVEAEARVATAAGSTTGDGGAALQAYQKQLLSKLVAIREALASGDGDVAHVIKERDALREENEKLKKEALKLNYRINHLVKNLT